MNNKRLYIGGAIVVVLAAIVTIASVKPGPEIPPVAQSKIVELKNGDTYDLVASPVKKEIGGKTYTMLAYNGSIPGPLIKIAQGAEVTINFTNDTGMKTLLHSHGVRMDNAFDGSQTTQEEMGPGEAFSYKLKFPDAGVYWYHPHVREDLQQELGLYGNYFVVPESGDYWSPVNREITLFLDDILIENGQINLSTKGVDRTLMGRFGNVMLVNGEDDYKLDTKKGEAIRLYVTNAANTRPFNFRVEGARMKLVGADGGAYEKESWADSVVLGPSERAIIEILFESPGTYVMQNQTPEKISKLGKIVVSDEQISQSYATDFEILRLHKETITSIDPLRSIFSKPPDKRINLTVDMMGGMMSNAGGHMMPGGQMMSGGESIPAGGVGVVVGGGGV